jgi:hypothetical protein
MQSSARSALDSGTLRIGLSTSAHGYNAIVPLVHAATIVCSCAQLFIWMTGGGYFVMVPEKVRSSELLELQTAASTVQASLHNAGGVITTIPAVLNAAMLSCVIHEVLKGAGSVATVLRRSVASPRRLTPPSGESRLLGDDLSDAAQTASNEAQSAAPQATGQASTSFPEAARGPPTEVPDTTSRAASPERHSHLIGSE